MARRPKGTKVGDAYVDVNYDTDEDAALKGLTATQKKMAAEIQKITRQAAKDAKTEESYAAAGDRAARAFAAEMDKTFKKAVKSGLSGPAKTISEDLKRVEKDVDRTSRRVGNSFGKSIQSGLDSAMSLLPGRMESLFSGKGGPIGLAIGGAIVAGIAITLPAIGAMISGAMFAGIGALTVVGGIALVAKDKRVLAAIDRLRKMFMDKIFNGKGAEAFVKAVVPALDKVTKALKGWAPIINSILISSSKFVDLLTTGLIGFVNGFLKPLDELMKSQFMTDIMRTLGEGFTQLGQALGDVFTRFLGDKDAMDGAVMGLRDLFDLVAGSIRTVGDLLRFLSRTWKEWNTDPDGLGPLVSRVDRMKQLWGDIKSVIDGIGGSLSSAFGTNSDFEKTTGGLEEFKNMLSDINTLWDGIFGRQSDHFEKRPGGQGEGMGRATGIEGPLPGQDPNKGFWANQWDDIQAELKTAWASILSGATNFGQKFAMIFINMLTSVAFWFTSTSADIVRASVAMYASILTVAKQGQAQVLTGTLNFGAALVTAYIDIRQKINQIWTDNLNAVVIATRAIGIVVVNATNLLNAQIAGVLDAIKNRWAAMWKSLGDIVGSVFRDVGNVVGAGLDRVINIMDNGIDKINGVLSMLGITAKIPHIGGNGSAQRGGGGNFAGGGLVTGKGSGTSDSISARLSNKEFVVNAKATSRHRSLLNAINGGMPGFARGGEIGGAPSGDSGLWRSMFAWISARSPGVHLASGYRPGDPLYHGKGQATDLTFPDGSERRGGGMAAKAFNMIKSTFMSGILELIWDFAGNNAVWNGKNHFFTGPTAGPGTHNDHIHWAMSRLAGNGTSGGLLALLLKPWKDIMSSLMQPAMNAMTSGMPNNALGWLGQGAGKFVGNHIAPWAKSLYEGIGGFKNGGWLMPGQLGYNETGKPEAVFNQGQLGAMGGVHIENLIVHVGGDITPAQAKKAAETIRAELKKLAGRNGGKANMPS